MVAVHYMLIEPEDQRIHVYTIPPDAEAKLGQVKGRIHRHTLIAPTTPTSDKTEQMGINRNRGREELLRVSLAMVFW